jgi:hypothetical protein
VTRKEVISRFPSELKSSHWVVAGEEGDGRWDLPRDKEVGVG